MITRRTPRPKALWKQMADAKAAKKSRRAKFYAGRAGTRTIPRTLTKRKPIRRVSRKMAKVKAYYYELRDEFLAEHTVCAVHGGNCVATECHHQKGRAETLLIDARFWQAVCSGGHGWIHNQIADARADGFICKKGDWNRAPEDAETARLRGIIQELTK